MCMPTESCDRFTEPRNIAEGGLTLTHAFLSEDFCYHIGQLGPDMDLFFLNVLLNRREMAEIFWERSAQVVGSFAVCQGVSGHQPRVYSLGPGGRGLLEFFFVGAHVASLDIPSPSVSLPPEHLLSPCSHCVSRSSALTLLLSVYLPSSHVQQQPVRSAITASYLLRQMALQEGVEPAVQVGLCGFIWGRWRRG